MKFNWGTGAASLFIGFILLVLTLVYIASRQKVELVTDDYYEKELEVNEILIKKQNAEALSSNVKLGIEGSNVIITFPEEIEHPISGKVLFFKPSDKNADFEVNIKPNEAKILTVPFNDKYSGMYKVKIDWSANNTGYYFEDQIVLP